MTEAKLGHLPKPKNSAGRNLPAAIGVSALLGGLVLLAVWIGPVGWYPLVAAAVAVAMARKEIQRQSLIDRYGRAKCEDSQERLYSVEHRDLPRLVAPQHSRVNRAKY